MPSYQKICIHTLVTLVQIFEGSGCHKGIDASGTLFTRCLFLGVLIVLESYVIPEEVRLIIPGGNNFTFNQNFYFESCYTYL